MTPTNTIVILSDEHNRDVAGCYGDPLAKTPNLDALASEGVLFMNAYTNSPVCVPARASFATGRYVHQIGAWDSVSPHDGSVAGWGADLIDAGHEVISIGKLHFRSSKDSNGFSQEMLPMHVHNGTGWLSSLLRSPPEPLESAKDMALEIGMGETAYTAYDRDVTKTACDWIKSAAQKSHEKPWVLYVGLVAPHFPLIAPEDFYRLYDDVDIPPPRQYPEAERPRHPVLDAMRAGCDYDGSFDAEKVRIARQAYYGLCSFMDDNVGKIIDAVKESGQREATRIIYAADHGDNIGHRGLWGKSVMYEDSVAIPMIMSGPGLPRGSIETTPVSLVDLHPTILEFLGLGTNEAARDLPGTSLSKIIETPDPERAAFSEYHDWCSITGMFMLRKGEWKLVEYPGYAPQLFNLRDDPHEMYDLAQRPEHHDRLTSMKAELAKIVDIDAVNQRAFADQAIKIENQGGREAILKAEEFGYTPPPNAGAT